MPDNALQGQQPEAKKPTAQDVLLDPEFHQINDPEAKRMILGRVWPEFAGQSKETQDHTIQQSPDFWQEQSPDFWQQNFGIGPKPQLKTAAGEISKAFEPAKKVYDFVKKAWSSPKGEGLMAPPTEQNLQAPPIQPTASTNISLNKQGNIPTRQFAPPSGYGAGLQPPPDQAATTTQTPTVTAPTVPLQSGILSKATSAIFSPLLDIGSIEKAQIKAEKKTGYRIIAGPRGLGTVRVPVSGPIQSGIREAVGNLMGSLTSPVALVTMGAPVTKVAGIISPALKMAIEAGFSGTMAVGAVQNSKEAVDALQRKDWEGFTKATLSGLGNAVFSFLSGKGLVKDAGAWIDRFQNAVKTPGPIEEVPGSRQPGTFEQPLRLPPGDNLPPIVPEPVKSGTLATGPFAGLPAKQLALPPGPTVGLPGGGLMMTGKVIPGEEGGIPVTPPGKFDIVGRGAGIAVPPAKTPEAISPPPSNISPINKEEFRLMQQKLDMIKSGQILPPPGPEVAKALKRGLQRLDLYDLEKLRDRLGLSPTVGLPETGQPGGNLESTREQPAVEPAAFGTRADDERQLEQAARSEMDRASSYGERSPVPTESRSANIADATREGTKGWGGLERTLPGPPTGTSEVSGASSQPGAGQPGVAELTSLLKPGQTVKGMFFANAMEHAPSFTEEGLTYRIVDESGHINGETIQRFTENKTLAELTTKVDNIFGQLRHELSGDPDFRRAIFFGNTLNPEAFAINYDGDQMYGNGGECPVFYNPMASLDEAFKLVNNGDMHPEDIHKQIARQTVVSMFHELVHQKFRDHGGMFHQTLEFLLDNYKPVLDRLTSDLENHLGSNSQAVIKNMLSLHDMWTADASGYYKEDFSPPPKELLGNMDRREIGDPPRFLSTRWLDKPLKLDTEGTPGVIDIAKAMNDFIKEKYGKLSPPGRGKFDDALEAPMIDRFIKHAGNEFLYQVGKDNSMMGWYQKDIERMNELLTHARADFEDPAQRKLFSVLVGILSPGNDLKNSFNFAMKAYGLWADNGTIPIKNPEQESGSWGNAGARAFSHNLITLQRVIDMNGGDVDKAVNWLLTEHPVKELNAVKYSEAKRGAEIPGGTNAMRLGSYMFGEKVGAFIPNLLGVQSELTMDRWWTRMWNRIMGTTDIVQKWDENQQAYTPSLRDIPRSWAENQLMRKASDQLASILKVKVSTLQAVMWYYEQSLYAAHGSTNKPFSLSQAAESYLDENGIPYEPRQVLQSEGKVPANNREAAEPGTHAFNQGLFKWGEPGKAELAKPPEATGGKLTAPTEEDVSFPFGSAESTGKTLKLPDKIDYAKLGKFVDSFGSDEYKNYGDGWITPNGGIISNGWRSHDASLHQALGNSYFDYDKTFGQVVNKYGLIRTKIQRGNAAAELFGYPTSSQMRMLRQMEHETDSKLLYDISDPMTHQVLATGQGVPRLERDLATKPFDREFEASPRESSLGIAEETGKDKKGLVDQYGKPVMSGAPGGEGKPPGQPPPSIVRPLKDIMDTISTIDGKKVPFNLVEAFRNIGYTGPRDMMVARGNQLGEDLGKIISDETKEEGKKIKADETKTPQKNSDRTDLKRMAMYIYREFKNIPNEELDMWLDGTNPFYKKVAEYELERGVDPTKVNDIVQRAKDNIGKLKDVIEQAKNPTDAMRNVADKLTPFLSDRLDFGKALGMLHSNINPENYMTHILISKDTSGEVIGGVKTKTNVTGAELTRRFGFANERTFSNILEAIAMGFKPRTLDAIDAMMIYNKSFANSAATHQFVKVLEGTDALEWRTKKGLINPEHDDWIPYSKGDNPLWKDPRNFVDKDGNPHSESYTAYGPPKLVKALSPITEPNYFNKIPVLRRAAQYSSWVKSVEVALSAFHAKNLTLSAIDNMGLDETIKAYQEVRSSAQFKEEEVDAIGSGMPTPILGRNIALMKRMGTPLDGPTFLDKLHKMPVIEQAETLSRLMTEFTFDQLQRTFKVHDFSLKKAGWIADHMDATGAQLSQAKRDIARQVNAVYGGLHWENLGWHKSSVSLMRMLMFAPDWKGSNLQGVTQALPFVGTGGEATTAARWYWGRAIIWGALLSEGMSLLLTGKFSKKPLQVYMGNDNKENEIYANWFTAGGPQDVVNFVNNQIDYGPIEGTARSLGAASSPMARYAFLVMGHGNHDFMGNPIMLKGASPIVNTLRGLKNAYENIGPMPFTATNALSVLFDGKEHNPAEYFSAIALAARSRHVAPNVPEGYRKVASGYKEGTLVKLGPNDVKPTASFFEQLTGNKVYLPSVNAFRKLTLAPALSAYDSADEETRARYKPYMYAKMSGLSKYTNPQDRALLNKKLIELGFRNQTPENSLQAPPENTAPSQLQPPPNWWEKPKE